MEKTIMLMNVPTNCGSVVKRLRIPRYIPVNSPVDVGLGDEDVGETGWWRCRASSSCSESESEDIERRW